MRTAHRTSTAQDTDPAEADADELLGAAANSLSSRPAKKRAGAPSAQRRKPSPDNATANTAEDLGTWPASRPAALLWLRQDLRLHDNPALLAAASAATQLGGNVVPVFVHSPLEDGDDLGTGAPAGGPRT
jgi:hypothetical protein